MGGTYGSFLREKRGNLSQRELADRIEHVPGLKQSHISLIERELLLPTGVQHGAVADALLLTDEDREHGFALLRTQHLEKLHLTEKVRAA